MAVGLGRAPAVVVAQVDSISWVAAMATWGVIGLLLVVSGWLVIVVAERAADGRLRRNAWAGVRTRTTRSSDEAWSAAHRAAEPLTKAGGAIMIVSAPVAALLGLTLGRNPDAAMGVWAAGLIAGTMVAVALVIAGAVKGQRAAREVAGT